jgi:predicted acetyltransferase
MTIEIRPAREDEMGEFSLIGAYVYGGSFGDGEQTLSATANRAEWTLCAFVDGQMASMFCTIPFTMRAAGKAIAMGGITSIGTLPEFRRQGLSRKLMTQALADMHEKGQSIASLWASQAAIYQRYQFAMTTVRRSYSIDTVDLIFNDSRDTDCKVRRVALPDDFDTIKSVYIEFIKDRFCYLHRSRALWHHNMLEDVAADGPTRIAVSYDSARKPVGYVIYTLRSGKVDHEARSQEIKVREIIWHTIDACRSLWQFLGAHDLVGRIVWHDAPADDPAHELLAEPRLLHARDTEGAWFRIVDVAGALSSRGYAAEGSLKIGIEDDQLTPWNTGTYELKVSDGAGEVTKGTTGADIRMSLKTLTSLYTGFRSAGDLSNWGLLTGDEQSIALAGQLFSARGAPHLPDNF